MDALDEFFRVWCAPEAWCDRCKEYPAIHIAVQDNADPYGSRVTYARVWDPGTQAYVALCRKCNTQHMGTLGSQACRYAPPVHQQLRSPQQQHRYQNMRRSRLQHLQRRVWRLFTRLVLPWRSRKPSWARLETKGYSRTGT